MKVNITEKHFHKQIGTLIFSISNNKNQLIMAISQSILQKSTVSVETADRKGNPAAVQEGSFVATSSDEAIFTVGAVTTADNINFDIEVISAGIGTAQLNIAADADLGEGVVSISGFSAVEVLPEMAAGFVGFAQSNVVDK